MGVVVLSLFITGSINRRPLPGHPKVEGSSAATTASPLIHAAPLQCIALLKKAVMELSLSIKKTILKSHRYLILSNI